MKLLAIQSSPNREGLTAETAIQVIKGVNAAGYDAELIHLNDAVINKCKGL